MGILIPKITTCLKLVCFYFKCFLRVAILFHILFLHRSLIPAIDIPAIAVLRFVNSCDSLILRFTFLLLPKSSLPILTVSFCYLKLQIAWLAGFKTQYFLNLYVFLKRVSTVWGVYSCVTCMCVERDVCFIIGCWGLFTFVSSQSRAQSARCPLGPVARGGCSWPRPCTRR